MQIEPQVSNVNGRPEFQTASDFKMRCPNCQKLYSVQSFTVQTAVSPLRFECVGCQTLFQAAAPADLRAAFLETSMTPAAPATEPTGSSREAIEPLAAKVRSTLVSAPLRAPSQEQVAREIEVGARADLIALWEKIAAEYLVTANHEAFMTACHKAGALTFASYKYSRVLEATPNDETARRMRSRAIALASLPFEARKDDPQLWRMFVPSRAWGFGGLLICLGTILAGVGMGLPSVPHLAGLGLSMIALAIGLRFYVRKV